MECRVADRLDAPCRTPAHHPLGSPDPAVVAPNRAEEAADPARAGPGAAASGALRAHRRAVATEMAETSALSAIRESPASRARSVGARTRRGPAPPRDGAPTDRAPRTRVRGQRAPARAGPVAPHAGTREPTSAQTRNRSRATDPGEVSLEKVRCAPLRTSDARTSSSVAPSAKLLVRPSPAKPNGSSSASGEEPSATSANAGSGPRPRPRSSG